MSWVFLFDLHVSQHAALWLHAFLWLYVSPPRFVLLLHAAFQLLSMLLSAMGGDTEVAAVWISFLWYRVQVQLHFFLSSLSFYLWLTLISRLLLQHPTPFACDIRFIGAFTLTLAPIPSSS